MADEIQAVFLTPAIAVARLGGSSVPQECFQWAQSTDPRSSGETIVMPDWSLTIEPDASVTPYKPVELRFRDGALIRPVCPFIEVWASVGDAREDHARRVVPVTPTLLKAHGVALENVKFVVTAINAKAARRARRANLRFGTFPPVTVFANDHRTIPLAGTSPPDAAIPMIPSGRNIPLGSIQIMRSRLQPAGNAVPWSDIVNVEVLRLRFTPAEGHCYGPPIAAAPLPIPSTDFHEDEEKPAVAPEHAFLNPDAGWFNAFVYSDDQPGPDEPSDTFDGADVDEDRSLGIVDDTCEARIEIHFDLPQQTRHVSASSTVFVAPPDFAPDRRPFLSLADELNDRQGDMAMRNAAMSRDEHERWVEDLFERIYETTSLFNIDRWRNRRASDLTGKQLTDAIPQDTVPDPKKAMGGRDALRNRFIALPASGANNLLPLTQHARSRHHALSNIQSLRGLIDLEPDRLHTLIRKPFSVQVNENPNTTTMAMPPFMRNSNARPLTLTVWQYDLLMQWVDKVRTTPGPIGAAIKTARTALRRNGTKGVISERAAQRRAHVLQDLRPEEEP